MVPIFERPSKLPEPGGIVRSVRRGALALALTACAPAPSAPPPAEPALEIPRLDGGTTPTASGGLRFGRPPPIAGDRWRVRVTAKSTSADPAGGVQLSEYVSEYVVEVLATEGPAPSSVRLTFDKNVHRYQGTERATAVDQKTYVLDARAPRGGADPSPVRDASGAAASAEETERVLDTFPDLGTRTQIDQVLPDADMAIGDARDELAAAVLRVIHPRAWTLNRGSAVLVRADVAGAVFAIDLDATGSNGLRLVVAGEARVRLRDARLVELALDGTYDHAHGATSDPGTFSLRRTASDL